MRTESSLESLADFFTNCLLRHLILNPLSLRPRHSSRPQSWCVVETFHAEFRNRKVEKFGQWWREGKISFSVLGAKFAFTSLVWMRIQFEDFLPLSPAFSFLEEKGAHLSWSEQVCHAGQNPRRSRGGRGTSEQRRRSEMREGGKKAYLAPRWREKRLSRFHLLNVHPALLLCSYVDFSPVIRSHYHYKAVTRPVND